MSSKNKSSFQYTIRILVVGNSNVGKTSLVKLFEEEKDLKKGYSIQIPPLPPPPTLGIDIFQYESKAYKFEFFDVCGKKSFLNSKILSPYYKSVDCILMVYDVTNFESFNDLERYWMKEIISKNFWDENENNIPVFVVGNKIDLEEERVVKMEHVKELCENNNNLKFFETSCKDVKFNGIKVQEIMENYIARKVVRRFNQSYYYTKDSIYLKSEMFRENNNNGFLDLLNFRKYFCCVPKFRFA